MKTAVLTRLESTDQGTFGILKAEGFTAFSGELPWRENASNVSCIPEGTYKCVWTCSPRFKRFMYLLESVPQRTGVRKHSANFMGDKAMGYEAQLNGCIALSEKLGWMNGQKCLLVSAPAMRKFENHMQHNTFTLEVRSA